MLPVPGGSQHGLSRPALQKGQSTITNRAVFKPASRRAKLLNVYSRPSESGSQSLRPACGSDLARWLSRRPCHYAHCFPTIKTLEIRLHSAASTGGAALPGRPTGWMGRTSRHESLRDPRGQVPAPHCPDPGSCPPAFTLPSGCPCPLCTLLAVVDGSSGSCHVQGPKKTPSLTHSVSHTDS